MLKFLGNIWLGLLLIVLASSVLLISDVGRRQGRRIEQAADGGQELPRLAILQWTSTDLLDSTVAGIVDGLRQQGYEDGRTASIRFLNASGDSATANMMAKELAGGGCDMVLTASTLAMQAMANANREGRITHVFGAVTDPYGAGVGIAGPEPSQHPRYLVGVGTFQPVAESVRIASHMNPKLRRIGVVWNPGEDNSEACVVKARAICLELEFELVEANANNTSEVPEAIRSVLTRGVDVVWIGGDTVAMSSINAIVSATRAAGIPVFTNDPGDVKKGALFGLGASYRQVGVAVGELGGKILHGTDPASIGVKNMVPEVLGLNEALAAELSDWSIPEDIRARAKASQAVAAAATATVTVPREPTPGRQYRAGILYFGPDPIFEMAIAGIKASLRDAGFVEGKNLTLFPMHANSDMSMLPQIAQRLNSLDLDVIIPLSTPCLGTVLGGGGDVPIVFGVVSAPLEAGGGKSFEEHLPNVTGAVWVAPKLASFDWLQVMFPKTRALGVVYNPAQANSQRESAIIRDLTTRRGLRLEERCIGNASEVVEALPSLFSSGIDAVFGMADNTVVTSFTAVAQACRRERIPLVADDSSLMGSGALFCIGASPDGEGRNTGRLVARILLGESPAHIPFTPSVETETAVDFAAARHLGVSFPVDLLKEADIFLSLHARKERPLRIAMVNLVENRLLDLAQEGVLRGLRESGLTEKDFTVKHYNAQGEMAQLPAVLDAARNDDPDLIVTVTTPAMVAAANRIKDVPIVFTVASDPVALGLFSPETRPANIVGVHDDPPVGRLLDMARKHDPALTSVGILFDSAQPNSVLSVEMLRKACAERKVTLREVTASNVSELATAVQAIVQMNVDAILLSADNLVNSGFAVIHMAASRAGIPVYVTSADLVAEGADGAIGDDYEGWGAQSGRLAAKVLAGVPPIALPIEATRIQKVIEPAEKAAAPSPKATRSRPYEVRIVRYNDVPFSAEACRGIMDGFKEAGLTEGRDINVRTLNAQGDMATLSSILTTVVSDAPDLIMPIATPSLQAALRQAGSLSMVFCSVGDGVRAGAGTSVVDHLPNVTGVTTRSPFADMAKLIKRTIPNVQKVGTLFTPAEINSELYRQWFEEALTAEGLALVAVPVSNSAEAAEATTALLRSGIQVVGQISDNTTRPGYSQIAKRAHDAGLPFYCFDSTGLQDGAALALALDHYQAGVEAAAVAVRILRGQAKPKDIPFANTQTEVLVINSAILARFGIALPPEYQARCTEYEK